MGGGDELFPMLNDFSGADGFNMGDGGGRYFIPKPRPTLLLLRTHKPS